MTKVDRCAVGLAVATLLACSNGGGDATRTSTQQTIEGTASYRCTTTSPDGGDLGNDFTGNYVWIHGYRSSPVDAKYPCLAEFTECRAFQPDGYTLPVDNLCPSIDTPQGTWTFEFYLSTDADCREPMANIVCPIISGETLTPGLNHNVVACTTDNASKDFQFCIYDPKTRAGIGKCPPLAVPPG